MQIIALWWKGLALHGIVRLLATTAGQKARDLLEKGCRLGASARCWGSVEVTHGSGMQTVRNNCRLITWAPSSHFFAAIAGLVPDSAETFARRRYPDHITISCEWCGTRHTRMSPVPFPAQSRPDEQVSTGLVALCSFDLTEEPATGLFLQSLTTSPGAELLPSIQSGEHQQSLALQRTMSYKDDADGATNEAYQTRIHHCAAL